MAPLGSPCAAPRPWRASRRLPESAPEWRRLFALLGTLIGSLRSLGWTGPAPIGALGSRRRQSLQFVLLLRRQAVLDADHQAQMSELDLLLEILDLRGEGQGLRFIDPGLAQHG